MRKKVKFVITVFSVFVLLLFSTRLVLLELIEDKLVSLANYYQTVVDIQTEVIADQRGDGSERLIQSLPIAIRGDAEELSRYLRIYSGPQSRVYISFSKKDDIGVVVKIETLPRWKDSFLFYYGMSWIFCSNEAYLTNLIQSGECSHLHGKILSARRSTKS